MVHLQYFGKTQSKAAQDFKVGELMMWNGGLRSEVLEILNETGSFITFKISGCGKYGEVDKSTSYERRLKKNRQVAIG